MSVLKLGESLEGATTFRRRSIYAIAVRLREDTFFETSHGWVQAFNGQWIIEIADRVRFNLDDEAFRRSYLPDRRAKER